MDFLIAVMISLLVGTSVRNWKVTHVEDGQPGSRMYDAASACFGSA
jgi:hypothetical protein